MRVWLSCTTASVSYPLTGPGEWIKFYVGCCLSPFCITIKVNQSNSPSHTKLDLSISLKFGYSPFRKIILILGSILHGLELTVIMSSTLLYLGNNMTVSVTSLPMVLLFTSAIWISKYWSHRPTSFCNQSKLVFLLPTVIYILKFIEKKWCWSSHTKIREMLNSYVKFIDNN